MTNNLPPLLSEDPSDVKPKDPLDVKHISDELTEEFLECAFRDEPKEVVKAIKNDVDLIVSGVTGSGRTVLIKTAAARAGADVIAVDCIKAIKAVRFLDLLYGAFKRTYREYSDLNLVNVFSGCLDRVKSLKPSNDEYVQYLEYALDSLLLLIEEAAKSRGKRVVTVFRNFGHLQSFEKDFMFGLQKKISDHQDISYVIITTFSEMEESPEKGMKEQERKPQKIKLQQIDNSFLRNRISAIFKKRNLTFRLDDDSLNVLLDVVQGHFGTALTLCKRILYFYSLSQLNAVDSRPQSKDFIYVGHVKRAIADVLEEMNTIFSTMLLSLPDPQCQLLECLAVEPTSKPYGKAYIDKYGLSKGGTIQRALTGLKAKGLIYVPSKNKDGNREDQYYRVALPLLSEWIRRNKTY